MKLLIATLLACAAPFAIASGDPIPATITSALADPARPAADTARDATRHPAEILAFMGVKPGDHVLDFIMGGGYWTRILAKSVGDQGQVTAYQPAEFISFKADYATQQDDATKPYANVTASRESLATFAPAAGSLDSIITVQNWHDLHLKSSPAGFAGVMAKRMFAALKPGGVLLVIDHVAATDPDFALPQQLHRIDPAAARAEIEGAGFVFDGELSLLRNTDDNHTLSVFDPALRGHTDQFIYRFRKPAA